MGEIVNLRRARRRSARARDEDAAAANRAAFGVPKADKRAARAERKLFERRLEGHRLAGPGEDE